MARLCKDIQICAAELRRQSKQKQLLTGKRDGLQNEEKEQNAEQFLLFMLLGHRQIDPS